MKKIIWMFFLLVGCASVSDSIVSPETFEYKEIMAGQYRLASWQKDTNPAAPVRIYIEGDGHSFNHRGQATTDPTPKNPFMRELAFNDPNPNVVYLARPCQYVMNENCTPLDWTTGRFSKAVVDSMSSAVKEIADGRPVVLIGYSGGAMVSGLIIARNSDLSVQQWLTIAGVLDHEKWTAYHKVPPLLDSLNMSRMLLVPQLHFVGGKDSVVPPVFLHSVVPKGTVFVVPEATHGSGFDVIRSYIY